MTDDELLRCSAKHHKGPNPLPKENFSVRPSELQRGYDYHCKECKKETARLQREKRKENRFI